MMRNLIYRKRTWIKTIVILFLMFLQAATHAQNQSSGVPDYMEAVRQGKGSSFSTSFLYNRENEKILLEEIKTYLKDTVSDVRLAAYTLLTTLGKQSSSTELRQQVATALIGGWRDADTGIVGTVGAGLQQFRQADFNIKAKDSLQVLVRRQAPHYSKLVMLCGYVGMTDLISLLQSQISSGAIKSRGDKAAAYLALCRLGDEQAISYVVKSLEAAEINDDLVYDFFPDLIYTRQRIVFDYMIRALNNDEKNCESANPEISENIPCAYRIMELLAPVIKEFPLTVDASGDINTSDYPSALREARAWFQKMNSNYVIISDTF